MEFLLLSQKLAQMALLIFILDAQEIKGMQPEQSWKWDKFFRSLNPIVKFSDSWPVSEKFLC